MDYSAFYLNAAGRYPLLSPVQEIDLAKAVQEWMKHPDYPAVVDRVGKRGKRAKERMLQSNMRLVAHVARRFERRVKPGSSLELPDLLQEGHIALLRAIEKFDPTRGYKFSTYAYWWIRQGMHRAFETQERMIRVPSHLMERINRTNRAIRELSVELGRMPTRDEVAKAIDLSPEQFNYYLSIQGKMVALDGATPGDEPERTFAEVIADPATADEDAINDDLQFRIWSQMVRGAWPLLHAQEQLLLQRRYGLDGSKPQTLNELKEGLGITREATRLRLIQAERKLKFLATQGNVA